MIGLTTVPLLRGPFCLASMMAIADPVSRAGFETAPTATVVVRRASGNAPKLIPKPAVYSIELRCRSRNRNMHVDCSQWFSPPSITFDAENVFPTTGFLEHYR